VRKSCRLCTNWSMKKMLGMAVVNVSFRLNENASSFEVMVPQSIPVRQSSMRNNMSSELESTRKRVCLNSPEYARGSYPYPEGPVSHDGYVRE